MKKIFFLLATLLPGVMRAQNVGVGLNTNINEKLTVKGNGLFTYLSPTTKESGTTNLKIQSGPIGDGLVTFIKPDSSVQAKIHYNSTYGTLELNAGASINQLSLNNNGKVGIGIRSVYPGVALQIESETAGLLIPRMSTTQRNAINGLIDGLMIYNLTTSKLNQWQAGAWREVLNTESWYGGGTGQMWNIGDRVGINTAGPTERLDVVAISVQTVP
ncbi:MAG: hypothetical protein IPP72_01870 [Chitinophagaceae bacterium]|nr:hypothetical protein [Chitinophagaceae bacterium]